MSENQHIRLFWSVVLVLIAVASALMLISAFTTSETTPPWPDGVPENLLKADYLVIGKKQTLSVKMSQICKAVNSLWCGINLEATFDNQSVPASSKCNSWGETISAPEARCFTPSIKVEVNPGEKFYHSWVTLYVTGVIKYPRQTDGIFFTNFRENVSTKTDYFVLTKNEAEMMDNYGFWKFFHRLKHDSLGISVCLICSLLCLIGGMLLFLSYKEEANKTKLTQ